MHVLQTSEPQTFTQATGGKRSDCDTGRGQGDKLTSIIMITIAIVDSGQHGWSSRDMITSMTNIWIHEYIGFMLF